jgi:hypothetical protein
VENFWKYVTFTDEAHFNPGSRPVGLILREEGTRYNIENIEERGSKEGNQLYVVVCIAHRGILPSKPANVSRMDRCIMSATQRVLSRVFPSGTILFFTSSSTEHQRLTFAKSMHSHTGSHIKLRGSNKTKEEAHHSRQLKQSGVIIANLGWQIQSKINVNA